MFAIGTSIVMYVCTLNEDEPTEPLCSAKERERECVCFMNLLLYLLCCDFERKCTSVYEKCQMQ